MKRLLLLVALVLALPTQAAAHGDTGILELVSSEPAGDTAVDYAVQLTYASDGDPVSDADVTVTVAGADSLAMTPEGDGRYAATVTFPDAGEHGVRFAAEEPAATLEHQQVVTSASGDATTTTADAPNVAAEPQPDPDAAEGSSTWLLVLMAIIVVAMVVLAVAYVRGRRPTA